MKHEPTLAASAPKTIAPDNRWSPKVAYNDLPPIPGETLGTPGVNHQCQRAVEALDALDDATAKLANPLPFLETVALIEAQASSAIEGIITNVENMLKHVGKPHRSKNEDPEADDALQHHDAIMNAWQRREREPIGTTMATAACSTTKGRPMPVRQRPGTVIAGPRGIIYTPPTGEERIRSMLDSLWSFMRDDRTNHPLVRMAAAHHQFESIHPFTDGNGRTGRLINTLYLADQKLTRLPVLCHSRYILRNRPMYYWLLEQTRLTGDWEPWVYWMLEGVETTADWLVRCLARQEKLTARITAQSHEARPRTKNTDAAIRFVCSRLQCRSSELVTAGLATNTGTALAMLRRIASTGTLVEQHDRGSARFMNQHLLHIWTGD